MPSHARGVSASSRFAQQPRQEGKHRVNNGRNNRELEAAGEGVKESCAWLSVSRELETCHGGSGPIYQGRRGNRLLGCGRAGEFSLAFCSGGGQKRRHAAATGSPAQGFSGQAPSCCSAAGCVCPTVCRAAALLKPRRHLLLLPLAEEGARAVQHLAWALAAGKRQPVSVSLTLSHQKEPLEVTQCLESPAADLLVLLSTRQGKVPHCLP